jgi:hypothetical protein
LIEETDVVPRDVGGETGLGFEIRPSSSDPYQVYSIHHLPAAGSPGVSGELVRTEPEEVKGARVFSFGFDEGDPVGIYQIDVFVDDRLVRSAAVEVVEPTK